MLKQSVKILKDGVKTLKTVHMPWAESGGKTEILNSDQLLKRYKVLIEKKSLAISAAKLLDDSDFGNASIPNGTNIENAVLIALKTKIEKLLEEG